MKRLYLQVYLAFVLMLVVFGLLAGAAWLLRPDDPFEARMVAATAQLISRILPASDRPASELDQEVARLGAQFNANISVHDASGELLSSAGVALPAPDLNEPDGKNVRHWRRRHVFSLRLPDGRWISASVNRPDGHRWLGVLALLVAAIGIGAYPLARRITRRLENLKSQVDALGAGDLKARVQVSGEDEVAILAQSFNRAAERIEKLVNAKQLMLASASHELRTPLARIRVALELMESDKRPDLKAQVERDIEELDALLDDLMLASRLEHTEGLERQETVDLLALAAEEGARFGIEVGGDRVEITGDPRLLRHLLRNLMDNARRFATPGGTDVELSAADDGSAALLVGDDGPGIPESDLERVFEPFYRSGNQGGHTTGAGIGLFLVREIAHRHNAQVTCRNKASGGAEFLVTFGSN